MTASNGTATALAWKPQRDELVRRHRAARAAYNRAMDEHAAQLDLPIEIGIDSSSSVFVGTDAYRRALEGRAEMAAADATYFRDLPRMPVSCCPHCKKPLYRAFDPFGLEGLWWRSDAQPDEPPPCPHFCVLLGAVDLRTSPSRPDFDVHPGPGAPFVVPRLLQKEGMVAVVSEIKLDGRRSRVSGCLLRPAAPAHPDAGGALGAHELRLLDPARHPRLAPRRRARARRARRRKLGLRASAVGS